VSCSTISIDEFDNTIPVNPPVVNSIINPTVHNREGYRLIVMAPESVLSQLNTLTPVGIAIIIVAEVKYARVSTFNPTVNM
tara:strand:+ start:66 stop:308 length:243 start_codon:yes stop_codon:yes gene_type:complete